MARAMAVVMALDREACWRVRESQRVVSVIYWESCSLLVVQCYSYNGRDRYNFAREPELSC